MVSRKPDQKIRSQSRSDQRNSSAASAPTTPRTAASASNLGSLSRTIRHSAKIRTSRESLARREQAQSTPYASLARHCSARLMANFKLAIRDTVRRVVLHGATASRSCHSQTMRALFLVAASPRISISRRLSLRFVWPRSTALSGISPLFTDTSHASR